MANFEIIDKRARRCVTCMNWDSNLRSLSPNKQEIVFVSNNKARCIASNGQYLNATTASNFTCKTWQVVRKLKPLPAQLIDAYKRFMEEKDSKVSTKAEQGKAE